MFRNTLLVALRTMFRQFSYSLINVVGLAVGIACSLVIFLFVYGEWSYDRGFKNADRIYKVGISFFNIGNFGAGPEILLDVLPQEFDGIEAATRVQNDRNVLMEVDGQSYRENLFYVDSSFFKVFQREFVVGRPDLTMRAPNQAVLTESFARKFFGSSDALGKTFKVGAEKTEYSVVGVVRDLPFNATVTSDIFLSNHSLIQGNKYWTSAAFYSYLLLRPNVDRAALDAALDRVWTNHVYPESGRPMGFPTIDAYRASENAVRFHVHELRDVYLRSQLMYELTPGGSESNIYIFSAISVFILLLAAVNFVNLTTARAARRAKEVGIRKTMGTSRRRLVAQFLTESVMTTSIAMVIALVVAELFLLAFTYVTGTPLLSTIWKAPTTVLMFIAFSVLVGIAAGLYPAFYLTAFNPVRVLKGNWSPQGGVLFRNALVVFQFTVSMTLIVSALVVQQQLHFVQSKDLGFDARNIVTIDRTFGLDRSKLEVLKTALINQSGVALASEHTGEPGSRRVVTFSMYRSKELEAPLSINTYMGDENYLDILGMRLLKGRGFQKELASDTASIILNESAVSALGLPEDPIGAVINDTERVIGVVSDFHWESLHNAIAPVAIRYQTGSGQLSFKLEPGAVKGFLAAAESKWKEIEPAEAFSYHFVDGNFVELMKKDATLGKAVNMFTLLAIFISCLGLYGLSAYTAEQRTREIGIRKVLGATSSQIVLMLNRRFTLLVLLAVAISVPFANWLMTQWLETFAYRIKVGAGTFLVSFLLALVVAWLTVSIHSVRASWANPSNALKYE